MQRGEKVTVRMPKNTELYGLPNLIVRAAHKRKFTASQLIQALHKNPPLWRAGDVGDLVSQLIDEGKIRPANSFLGKGALTC